MTGEAAADRAVYDVTGKDRIAFLQGIVTNDVEKSGSGIVLAALLTPQGKYLADFFLVPREDAILLDVKTDVAEALVQRLSMYRLRADVQIVPSKLHVVRGLGQPPADALPDPRHPALGWRAYRTTPGGPARTDWDALRVEHLIPETGVELVPGQSYILETGFERLNGVDHRKGCYIGQEVTARMRHKGGLRRALQRVEVAGAAPVGTEITADGRAVGTLFTQAGGYGLALLRLDRTEGAMQAGEARVTVAP